MKNKTRYYLVKNVLNQLYYIFEKYLLELTGLDEFVNLDDYTIEGMFTERFYDVLEKSNENKCRLITSTNVLRGERTDYWDRSYLLFSYFIADIVRTVHFVISITPNYAGKPFYFDFSLNIESFTNKFKEYDVIRHQIHDFQNYCGIFIDSSINAKWFSLSYIENELKKIGYTVKDIDSEELLENNNTESKIRDEAQNKFNESKNINLDSFL